MSLPKSLKEQLKELKKSEQKSKEKRLAEEAEPTKKLGSPKGTKGRNKTKAK